MPIPKPILIHDGITRNGINHFVCQNDTLEIVRQFVKPMALCLAIDLKNGAANVFLLALGYPYVEETDNPVYRLFLQTPAPGATAAHRAKR